MFSSMSRASSRPKSSFLLLGQSHHSVQICALCATICTEWEKWQELDADDDGRAVAEEALIGGNSQLRVLDLATFSLTS